MKKFLTLLLLTLTVVAPALNNVDLSYLGNASKNWIRNGGAEQGRAGWVTYADAAGTTPVSCSGGSPTATWTVSATTPLADQYSFVWTHPASNVQGNGVAYDFTIDKAQQGKQQRVSLDYEVATGTFTAGQNAIGGASAVESDLEAYVYDKTNGALVGMTNNRLLSNGTAGQNAPFTATFQAASNSTSYRLCLHAATTVAVAHTLKIDSVKVSPQVTTTGPPVTDFGAVSWTPTGAWSTNTTYTGFWRRVGDSAEFKVKVATSGAPTGTFTLNLPSGMTIDTTKVPSDSGVTLVGDGVISQSGTQYKTHIVINNSTSIEAAYQNATTGATGGVTPTAPVTLGAGGLFEFWFKVPIVGWASNVAMSSDFDGRPVGLQVLGTPANVTAGNPIIFPTVIKDDLGGYNASTGQYTVYQGGWYAVSTYLAATPAGTTHIVLFKGGVSTNQNLSQMLGSSATYTTGFTLYFAKAGDVLTIVTTDLGISSFGSNNGLSIFRLPGQARIDAADTVSASYEFGNALTIASSSTDMIPTTPTKLFDRTGSYNTATGEWTCPIPGLYRYSFSFFSASASLAAADRWEGNLMKSTQGAAYATYKTLPAVYVDATRTAPLTFAASTLFDCLAGDKVKIQTDQNFGVTFTLSGGATQNWIDIERAGN